MTDTGPSSRPPRPARRPTQESPLVWGLLVAIMLLAFVNFLFVAIAAPSPYRVGLAAAAGAFLVLSVVLFLRSSREQRRARGAATIAADGRSHPGREADGIAGQVPPGAAEDLRSHDGPRSQREPGRPEDGPAA